MKRSLLTYLACPLCQGESLKTVAFHQSNEILDGVVICGSCKAWYLIQDSILEMLAPELNYSRRQAFFQAYSSRMKKLKLAVEQTKHDAASDAKKKQSEFFDDFSDHYVLETQAFWRAYYARTLQWFKEKLAPQSLILDVGCGNGLGSALLLRESHTVLGVDISRGMIKDALKRLDPSSHSAYFVADVEHLPLKKGIFDAAIGFGILHHVNKPENVIGEISRCLKTGGYYFGHENNKSIFRPLFDLSMKIFALWHEEAGEHQLFSQQELQSFCERYRLRLQARTDVFLPLHLFNLLGVNLANLLLAISDTVCHSLPILRHQGGTLVFRAQKH